MEHLQAFTHENLIAFMVVLAALAGIIILVANVVDAVRKLRRPQEREHETLVTHQQACERKFTNDKTRLDAHDKALEDLNGGLRAQCVAVKALLNHAIHNGNTTEMVDAASGLDDWLIHRK